MYFCVDQISQDAGGQPPPQNTTMIPNLPPKIPLESSNRIQNIVAKSSDISQQSMMIMVKSTYKTVQPGDSLEVSTSRADISITPISDSSDSELDEEEQMAIQKAKTARDSRLQQLAEINSMEKQKIAMQRSNDLPSATPSAMYRVSSDEKWDPDTVKQTKAEMEVRYLLSIWLFPIFCHCQIDLNLLTYCLLQFTNSERWPGRL